MSAPRPTSDIDRHEPPEPARPGRSRGPIAFAIAFSTFAHLTLLVVLSLILVEPPATIGATTTTPGQAALIAETDLEDSISTELASEVPEIDASDLQNVRSDADLSELASESLPGLESELVIEGGAGAGDATGFDDSGVGSGGSATFFGVEARGNRFAFIVDISGSMHGERIRRLRAELISSIHGLSDGAEFSIILYNDVAIDLSEGEWVRATPEERDNAARRIENIGIGGGTQPLVAFEALFSRSVPPDAVYFMTDGQFESPEVIAQSIMSLRRSARSDCAIHTMTFLTHDSADIMRQIARRTGGTYRAIGASP